MMGFVRFQSEHIRCIGVGLKTVCGPGSQLANKQDLKTSDQRSVTQVAQGDRQTKRTSDRMLMRCRDKTPSRSETKRENSWVQDQARISK